MALFVVSKLDSIQATDVVKLDVPEFSPALSTDALYDLVAAKFDIQARPFELICFGRSLKRNRTLACYGIKNGTIVYIFKQRNLNSGAQNKPQSAATGYSQAEVERISAVIGADDPTSSKRCPFFSGVAISVPRSGLQEDARSTA